MKATHLIIPLVLLLAVLSCTRHSEVSDTLAHADAVMEQYPDSALALLEAIPDSVLVTDRDRALHALLLTQALDKNYIDVTSDSLINIAVNYFQNHGDRYEMLSHYYKGIVSYEIGDFRQSTLSALKSRDFAEKLADTLYIARTNEQLADLYFRNYDFQNDIKLRTRAIEAYTKCKKDINAMYATLDLAISYTQNKDYIMAIKILDYIDITKYQNDTTFLCFYLKAYLKPLTALNRSKEALIKSSRLRQLVGNEIDLSIEENYSIANLFFSIDKIDSALYYVNNSIKNNPKTLSNINMQELLLNIYSRNNNISEVKESYDTVLKYQNRLIHEILQSRVLEIERNYYNQLSLDSQNKLNNLNLKIVGGCIIALLLICLISALFILQRQRTLNIRLKLEKIIDQIQQMETSISNKELELEKVNIGIKESQRYIYDLFHQKFEIIDKLSSFYFYDKMDSSKATLLYGKINEVLAQFCKEDTIIEMERIVDKYQNNIVSRFKSLFPNLPSYLNKLVLYTFLGFSVSTMAVFLQTSKTNIYVYRSKIKRIILNSPLDIPEEILEYFDINDKGL